jgi:hypothetical protein
MRTLLISLAAILCLGLATAAQAERRMFIISADAGYGVDDCLASGASCGTAAATAYCKTQAFAQATAYRKVDRDDITGTIPTGGVSACHGSKCDNFVAIFCTR